jgi:hypothetical protein
MAGAANDTPDTRAPTLDEIFATKTRELRQEADIAFRAEWTGEESASVEMEKDYAVYQYILLAQQFMEDTAAFLQTIAPEGSTPPAAPDVPVDLLGKVQNSAAIVERLHGKLQTVHEGHEQGNANPIVSTKWEDEDEQGT